MLLCSEGLGKLLRCKATLFEVVVVACALADAVHVVPAAAAVYEEQTVG